MERRRAPTGGVAPAAEECLARMMPDPHGAITDDGIHVGQLYRNTRRPRRVWRVTACYGDRYRLERSDNHGVASPIRKP